MGSINGYDFKAPQKGSACRDVPEYSDIAPRGAVVIETGTAAPIATVPLSEGETLVGSLGTRAERQKREELIDAIFDLRIAKTLDAVEISELRLARSEQRVYDLNHPKQLKFEGHTFFAAYCTLRFESSNLPPSETFTVTIAERPATVVTADDLRDDKGRVDLILD